MDKFILFNEGLLQNVLQNTIKTFLFSIKERELFQILFSQIIFYNKRPYDIFYFIFCSVV